MMAELVSITVTVPEQRIRRRELREFLGAVVPASSGRRLLDIAEATGSDTRYGALALAELRQLRTIEARSDAYRHHAVRLGEAASRAALDRARMPATAVRAVVGVSSTGFMMPTLETHLLDRLQLPPTARRVPVTQLGCAGGAAGLGIAATLADAERSGAVLMAAVELPSLSLPAAEASPGEILAALQFGDGAAAAVVGGGSSGRGPEIVGTGSAMFPGTLERNELQLTPDGLRLRPSRRLSELLRHGLAPRVDAFLSRHGLARRDIAFWAVHPRNPELLDPAAAGLELSADAVAPSRRVWQRIGNTMSAAVFHVLDEIRAAAPPPRGALGMIVAYGAGFACEMALLRADGWLCGDAPA
jgi:alkylresorcinol/alkylpyrone synthase